MNESLLQFIWKHKYLLSYPLKTTEGEPILIINPGMHNPHAGPDFFNGKIQIGKTLWAGNIEIHIQSSDWKKHNHQADKAYDNVILHVVWNHDMEIRSGAGYKIPTLQLNSHISESVANSYETMIGSKNEIPCKPVFIAPPEELTALWLGRLSVERLEMKCAEIIQMLEKNQGNWQQAFWQKIAMSFGQKSNALAFEQLLNLLPLHTWRKLEMDIISFQSLILGIAGFLTAMPREAYNLELYHQFKFLRKKHDLHVMDKETWNFGKVRPGAFPVIRILQFAELFRQKPALETDIKTCNSIRDLNKLFHWKTSQTIHLKDLYGEHPHEKPTDLKMPVELTQHILVNAIIPYLMTHADYHQFFSNKENARDWLRYLPAEDNHILREWNKLGIKAKKAEESQALIQLKNYYCNHKRCLECTFGNQILKSNLSGF